MKLLIDVGNTAIKAMLWQHKQLNPVSLDAIEWSKLECLVYACVGKSEALQVLLSKASENNIPCFEAKVSASLGDLHCAYKEYQNLGIDRWLAVIAAYQQWPNQPCVIIDAGTATTIDVINDDGQHLGGWILPGLDLMTHSLTANTQKVFDDERVPFRNELGRNTPNGLKNGALVASIGAVNCAVETLDSKNVKIICAGGYGKLIAEHITGAKFDAQLVFKGLNHWHEMVKTV